MVMFLWAFWTFKDIRLPQWSSHSGAFPWGVQRVKSCVFVMVLLCIPGLVLRFPHRPLTPLRHLRVHVVQFCQCSSLCRTTGSLVCVLFDVSCLHHFYTQQKHGGDVQGSGGGKPEEWYGCCAHLSHASVCKHTAQLTAVTLFKVQFV